MKEDGKDDGMVRVGECNGRQGMNAIKSIRQDEEEKVDLSQQHNYFSHTSFTSFFPLSLHFPIISVT